MEVRILGPLEVEEGGRVVALDGAAERALVALLALRANQVVPVDRLVEDLWDPDDPARGPAALRVHAARLRRALGPVEAPGDEVVRSQPPGYLLSLEPDHVDAARFERLVREGRDQLAEGAAAWAAATLRAGERLWRGRALADVAAPFAPAESSRLEELRLAALEDRIEAELACGRHAPLVAETERLVAAHPLRERLWGARIVALHGTGRRTEALYACREVARLVGGGLGLAPHPGLAELEDAIRAGRPDLPWPPPPPGAAPSRSPAGASPPVVAPTSRDADLIELGVGPDATALGRRGGDAATGIVTLLFTDLVGSTSLLDRLGDDAAEPLRRVHFRLLREAVSAAGGQEVKSTGEGLMVVFGSAVHAVACAVAMQQAVDLHRRREGDEALQVRVGLHVGEPMRDEDDYFGTPVVVARRLCDRAEGGQIVASDLVRALVGSRGGFTFSELGRLDLKGLAEPVVAWSVDWDAAAPSFPLPPALEGEPAAFVGRHQELEQLRDLWARVRGGRRQLALLAGEPGIGKTSLAGEVARAAHGDGATVLFGRCDEEALLPFQPFVEAVGRYVAAHPPLELHAQLGTDVADLAPLLPALRERLGEGPAGRDPDTERYRMFEAVASLLDRASQQAPLVLVLDDLHWADKPSLLLLRHVIRNTERSPLLILGTYRDTDLSRTHPLAAMLADLRRESRFSRLVLRGLSRQDVAALLAARAEHELEPRELALAEALWRETDGNPLFVREIINHLTETGAIYQVDTRWRFDVGVDQLGIPEGLKEVIGRRLSRLSEPANRSLRTASVLGPEFALDLLERVGDVTGDELLDAVEEAAAARLVVEVPGTVDRYTFSHALVRETLYKELSTARRVRLHHLIGQELERLHAEDLEPYLSELAHHFFEAASTGAVDKAVHYCVRAGDRALTHVAYEKAIAHYERGLQLLELDDRVGPGARRQLLARLADARRRDVCARIAASARRARSSRE